MPKSKAAKSKQHRDFLMRNGKYVKDNYMKWFDLAMKNFIYKTGCTEAQVRFMLFFYDYEWSTMVRVAEDYGRAYTALYRQVILPLKKEGYIEDYYSHGATSAEVDQMLGISQKASRVCLSRKGKQSVQRFYRMLDGREEIQYLELGSGGKPIE